MPKQRVYFVVSWALTAASACESNLAVSSDDDSTSTSSDGTTSDASSGRGTSSDTQGQTATSSPSTTTDPTGSSTSTADPETSSTSGSSTDSVEDSSSSSGASSPLCGNGAIEEGEACDDGNDLDNDDCTSACTPAACGDGFVWTEHEACDDGNDIDEDDCTSACTPAACGDGFVWAEHEACDDGNDIVHDDCTLDCAAAFCGDGFIHAGAEDCDDVNDLTGDGCAPGCVAESADIYMMISGPYQTGLLYRYAVDDDVWETIETGVWFDGVSGIVYREGIIYWVAGDSRLWSYDLDANTVELTDVTFPGTPTYELVAADGRIYAYNTWWSDGDGTDLHVIENGAITSTLHFASEAGFGATWDPVAHELYVNLGYSNWGDMTDQNLGFLVVDTTTDTVVRTFEVDLDGDGATGAYVGGAFYNRLLDGTLQRFDAFDGTHTDTGVAPASQWFSRAVANQATGKIYLSGIQTFSGHFEVYDTVDGSLTVLASPTVGDDDNYYAPMVLVYPEG